MHTNTPIQALINSYLLLTDFYLTIRSIVGTSCNMKPTSPFKTWSIQKKKGFNRFDSSFFFLQQDNLWFLKFNHYWPCLLRLIAKPFINSIWSVIMNQPTNQCYQYCKTLNKCIFQWGNFKKKWHLLQRSFLIFFGKKIYVV